MKRNRPNTSSDPQQPKPPKLTLSVTWRKVTVVLVVGVLLSLAGVATAAEIYKHSLRTRVNTIANALDTARADGLKRTPTDQESPDYDYLKTKLAIIKQANKDIQSLYLLARNDQGQLYVLVDSEADGSPGFLPRGELVSKPSPALMQMFDTNTDLIEGPTKNNSSTWLSVLAPVINDQNYGFVGVIGMDVPVSSYNALLSLAGGVPLVLALLTVAVILATDHSRRRQLEIVRFRAELASVASHELSAPLRGLRWAEETLLQQKLQPKAKQDVEAMRASTLQLQESVDDLLQMINWDDNSKARQLSFQACDVRVALDSICAMQQLAAKQRGITLQYAASWPAQVMVQGDERQLKRSLNNLVSNAIKYGKPHSTVRLGYSFDKASAMHHLTIQDHGAGIPLHEQSKVIGSGEGTGMGVHLSLQVIKQHGGMLRLDSQEGKGTTVHVMLPKLSKRDK